ncbi:aminotransferase class IV [bacterium]|nr:aminotransferase class IV [bacterium]
MFKERILDTLVFKDYGIYLCTYHIDRTFEAYRFLNLPVDKSSIAAIYAEIEQLFSERISAKECLRLVFSDSLPVKYSAAIQPVKPLNTTIRLQLFNLEQHPKDAFEFKWENRTYWEELNLKKQQDADDLLLVNPSQQIVETCRFNIFCYNHELNTVYTPMLSSGCLNGTYRRYALSHKEIALPEYGIVKLEEKNLNFDEIEKYDLYVANSVRGVLKAKLL